MSFIPSPSPAPSLHEAEPQQPVQPQQIRLLTPQSTRPHRPLFVFIPGMDGSGQLLRRQVDGLEQRFNVRCLALPVDDLSDWERLVKQVTQLITQEHQATGANAPLYLCGESFGACLAMKVATQIPTRVQHLTLLNPASALARLPWLRWGSQLSKLLPETLYRVSAMGLMPWLIALGHVEQEDRAALLQAMQTVHPRTAAWRLRLLRHFNLDDVALDALDFPVLLLAGKRDRLLPSAQEVQRIAQRLPQAQIRILPRSGHACLLEKQINLGDMLAEAGALPPLA